MCFLSLNFLHCVGKYSDKGSAEASFGGYWDSGPFNVEDASCVNFLSFFFKVLRQYMNLVCKSGS